MANANDRQVGGNHYGAEIQHWDFALSNNLGYFEGQITKYVTRWRKKGGIADLEKAQHFLQKLIESERSRLEAVREASLKIDEQCVSLEVVTPPFKRGYYDKSV